MTAPTMARLSDWLDGINGDYVTKDEVAKFLAAEQANHATDLANLKNTLVFNALAHAAACARTGARFTARQAAVRDNVAGGAANLVDGKSSGLLSERHVVDDKGTVRLASEMDGKDHMYVAGRYGDRSKRLNMFAMFHRAVAKKVGHNHTADVFDQATYEAFYRTFAPK